MRCFYGSISSVVKYHATKVSISSKWNESCAKNMLFNINGYEMDYNLKKCHGISYLLKINLYLCPGIQWVNTEQLVDLF